MLEAQNNLNIIKYKKNKGGSRKRSYVWHYFKEEKDRNIVRCQYEMCKQEFSYHKNCKSTTQMINHLKLHGIIENIIKIEDISQLTFEEIFLNWFIDHHLPFSIFDKSFNIFFNILKKNSNIETPSKIIIKNCIKKKKEIKKDILIKRLKDKYYIVVVDGWSSKAKNHYIGIGVHYLFNQKLTKSLLSLEYFDKRETSENIVECIDYVLKDYELKREYLLVFIADNAANIKRTGKLLTNSNEDVLGCIAHTLNLSISKGLKLDPFIKQIKKIISHFTNSNVAKRELFHYQKLLNLKTRKLFSFTKTRWGSIKFMVSRLIEEKMALTFYFNEIDYIYALSSDNWKMLEELNILLTYIVDWITFFEGDTYCTISCVVPCIKYELNIKLSKFQSIYCKNIYNLIYNDFQSRWILKEINILYYRATILDPRWLKHESLNIKFTELYYWMINELKNINIIEEQENIDHIRKKQKFTHLDSYMNSNNNIIINNNSEDKKLNEVNKYIHITISYDSLMGFDPINWWHINRYLYPHLFELAMQYLIIPASSAFIERVFSVGNQVINKRNNSLGSKLVEDQVYLKVNSDL